MAALMAGSSRMSRGMWFRARAERGGGGLTMCVHFRHQHYPSNHQPFTNTTIIITTTTSHLLGRLTLNSTALLYRPVRIGSILLLLLLLPLEIPLARSSLPHKPLTRLLRC